MTFQRRSSFKVIDEQLLCEPIDKQIAVGTESKTEILPILTKQRMSYEDCRVSNTKIRHCCCVVTQFSTMFNYYIFYDNINMSESFC